MKHFSVALVISCILGIGWISGLLREIVIAAQFGTSESMDVYRSAMVIPEILYYLLGGTIITSVLLPELVRLKAEDRKDAVRELISTVFILYIIVFSFLFIAGTIFSFRIMRLFLPGFESDKVQLTSFLFSLLLLAPFIGSIANLVNNVLFAHNKFLASHASAWFVNASTIVMVLLFAHYFGITALVFGVIFGEIAYLIFLLCRAWGLIYKSIFALKFKLRYFMSLKNSFFFRMLVELFSRSVWGVQTYLASSLMIGSISALMYSRKLIILPVNGVMLLSSSLGIAVVSEKNSTRDVNAIRNIFRKAFGFVFYVTFPLSLFLVFESTSVISILFERGTFTSESTKLTASPFMIYSAFLFILCINEFLCAIFYSSKMFKSVAFSAFLFFISNLILSIKLIPVFDYIGLAMALVCAASLHFSVLLGIIIFRTPFFDLDYVSMVKNAVAGCVALALIKLPFLVNIGKGLFGLLALFLLYSGAYFCICWALKSNEGFIIVRNLKNLCLKKY